jgi:uncharacterized protein YggU (UPF0235/DUF167 family)
MNIVRVKAFPDSPKESIEETAPGSFRIFVREPAERNEANRRILEVLALHLGLPPSRLRMIKGHKEPAKLIEIRE